MNRQNKAVKPSASNSAGKSTGKKKAVKKKASTKKVAKKKSTEKKTVKEAKGKTPPSAGQPSDFLIVGVGASAGGLEALEKLVASVKHPDNVAFIVVQHLSPNYKSTMDFLLQRFTTKLKIVQATDKVRVRPGFMYLNPSNKEIVLHEGNILLKKLNGVTGHRVSIDAFFRSLAADQRASAVCVILSGTGSDGTLGLRAVKGEGGMVLAQDPKQAKYDSMPRNAIATGMVDQVMPVEKMPALFDSLMKHPYHAEPVAVDHPPLKDLDYVKQVLELIRRKTGQDFSGYKQNTINHRIQRRMAVCQVYQIEDYVRYLKRSPREIETLMRDLLIGVTSFFRDPQAFKVLQQKALIPLVKAKKDRESIRVWVPGSATGEEAYSIAILLRETMDKAKKDVPVHIFATDMNINFIDIARRGSYPAAIAADVTPARLKAFFKLVDDRYIVNKDIRSMIVFSKHNIAQDPPFSKMDLVCCRNLLIYFSAGLQRHVIQTFRYALNMGGHLFLGMSETPGEFNSEFTAVSSKYKLFRLKKGTAKTPGVHRMPALSPSYEIKEITEARTIGQPMKINELATQILLKEHSPSYALINGQNQVLYLQGDASSYLALSSGEPSYDILELARPEIRSELAAVVQKAVVQKKPFESGEIQIAHEGRLKLFHIVVRPLPSQPSAPDMFMIIFEEKSIEKGPTKKKKKKSDPRYEALEMELGNTKEYARNLREEFDTTNEDLTSANEELQSANEELQSTNEELETSKEELQSVNEELESTNAELLSTVQDLQRANDDINNLMASTDVGTIFLDTSLRITRFTPKANLLFNLIEADIGRPITDMTLKGRYYSFIDDLRGVITNLTTNEAEIRTNGGRWVIVRMTPYRSMDNKIEGVVLTVIDVNGLKKAEIKAHDASTFADGIINITRQPLLVLNEQLNVVRANRAFYETFKTRQLDIVGKRIYDIKNGELSNAELMNMLESVLPRNKEIYDFELALELEEMGRRYLRINARRLRVAEKGTQSILLAIEDITERKQSLEKYQSLFSQMMDGFAYHKIIVKNGKPVDYVFLEANDEFERSTGLKKDDIIGKKVTEVLPGIEKDPFDWIGRYGAVALSGKKISFEQYFELLGRWFSVSAYSPEKGYFATVFEDITERKQMVENIEKANRKLETMMQEMNHRVKNNLIVVQTLLKLQSLCIDDTKSKELFKKSQARVQCISLIHDILYHTKDLSSVSFNLYISKLMKSLTNIFGIDTHKIHINVDIPDVKIDLNNIPPLGLIITELVTNAFKYAFPDDRSGRVAITLREQGHDRYVLSIKDNGIGIPEDYDVKKSDSFGMEILRALIDQVNGTLEIVRDKGTEFKISFAERWARP